jgi:hypothetical protein
MRGIITNVDNLLKDVGGLFKDEVTRHDVTRSLDHLVVLTQSAGDNLFTSTGFNSIRLAVCDKSGDQVFALRVEPSYDGTKVESLLNGHVVDFEDAMKTIKNHYNGSPNLESGDYMAIVDFAIDTNDKAWFDELHRKQQKIS